MGKPAQLSFAPKISGEFLSIWAKFPQFSKFFGWAMDEIRPNWEKFAQIGRNSPEIFEGEPQLRGFAHFEQVLPKKNYCVGT
jgi:hypothetical protein